MKKNISIDLRSGTMLGPICKVFEILPDLERRGYKVNIIEKNWDNENSGIKFIDNEYVKGESVYLWDSNIHPNDLFHNLVKPTFKNVNLIKKKSTLFSRISNTIPPFFQLRKLQFIDFSLMYCNHIELRRMMQLKLDFFLKTTTALEFLKLAMYIMYVIFFRKIKVLPESRGFRYKLHKDLMTEKLVSYISEAKSKNVKYILISSNFDVNKSVEVQEDRLKGGALFCETDWNSHYKYVMELDKFAIKTKKIKFILASKKAVDWSDHIKSDFIDLRNFEELGFTLSQSIYIAQELSSATLNWPSTYSIWITNCSGITHLTWRDNKDTSSWARNNLHEKNISNLLDIIGV